MMLKKGASWRELFDPSVTRVGDQNISVAINSTFRSVNQIVPSSVPKPPSNMLVTFGQRTELFGYLIERSSR